MILIISEPDDATTDSVINCQAHLVLQTQKPKLKNKRAKFS